MKVNVSLVPDPAQLVHVGKSLGMRLGTCKAKES